MVGYNINKYISATKYSVKVKDVVWDIFGIPNPRWVLFVVITRTWTSESIWRADKASSGFVVVSLDCGLN